MGWDFWRIEWPNAALLFALAVTPLVVVLAPRAAPDRATEIVYDPQPVTVLTKEHVQAGEPAAEQ